MRNLVLHDQDRLLADVSAQHIQNRLDLGFGQPRQRFVQQQHLGLGQDRHRDLQASFFTQAEMLDLPVAHVLQIEGFQDLEDLVFVAVSLAGVEQQMQQRRFPVRPEKAEHQVVDHAEVVEGGSELEGARQSPGHPCLRRHAGDIHAFVQDGSFVGGEISRQEVEESGFPRPVGADDAGNFMLVQRVIDPVNGDQCAEAFRDTLGFDNFYAQARPFCNVPSRWTRERFTGTDTGDILRRLSSRETSASASPTRRPRRP